MEAQEITLTNIIPARILVVDDHPNVAAMLARVLTKFDTPVEVITAHSGKEALDIVKDDKVDILITDFLMPGMNGLELAEKVRLNNQASHIILITAYDTPGLDLTARRLNIKDFLLKPINPEKIREVVGKALKEIETKSVQDIVSPAKFTILVADDRPDNIRLLTTRLHSEGYAYITSTDGIDTLEKIRKEKPDLVLMDVNMPRMDGFQVLREVRADPSISHTPVIIVSAVRIGSKDIREGLGLGADDYVTKPIDWRELSARIQTKLRVKQVEDSLRRRNEQLGLLPQIGQELSARLNVEELANVLLDRAVTTFGALNGHLVIFDMAGKPRHFLKHMRDFSPLKWEDIQDQILTKGLVARIIALKRGLVIEDTRSSPYWLRLPNDPVASALSVPLLGRRGVRGVLTLNHEETNHFTDEHLRLMQAIASQAAIAIENAQFYEEEHRRVKELIALNQLAQALNTYTNSRHLFEQIPAQIHQALEYPIVTCWTQYFGSLRLQSVAGNLDGVSESVLALAPARVVETHQSLILQEPGELGLQIENSNGSGASEQGISTVAVPLIWKDNLEGVLAVHSPHVNAFHESDLAILETMATQIAAAHERIRQYESAEQQRQQMAAVLQAAADAILLVDEYDNLQLVNLTGERLFTDIQARLGQPIPRQHGYDQMLDLFDKARSSNTVLQGELSWPDGRTFAALITPLENGSLVAVLHDVTHFKDLEYVKNEFIATASHDLKNPINAVMGYTDLLKQMGGLNDMQMDFVERVRRASMQMYELVLNLLEMARMDMDPSLKLQAHDLHDLLTNIVYEFQVQASSKEQTLEYVPPEGRPQVKVDLNRMKQVLRNLVGNAIKYTPDHGSVKVFSEIHNSKVWVYVQDTGLGIPKDDLPHIFDKFYRVNADDRADIQGNGLGLAIVKAIVEEHGGQIEVESVHGQGSTFRFSIPLVK